MTAFLTYLIWGSAGFSAIIILLLLLSSVWPPAGFIARLTLSWLCLSVCAVYGAIASSILRIAGYGGLGQWTTARAFKYTMRPLIGVEFIIEGKEHLRERPQVLISNHQSELDVLMLGCLFPKYTSVTAKHSLKYVPFLGWFMALSKTVFIDRGNRETARQAFDGAAAQMKNERQNVFIFPEGTRSYSALPDMLPLKKGAFHLAIQAKVPLVPIVVANYSNVLHVPSMHFKPGRVPVKVLPPIPTANLTPADVDELVRTTNELMIRELVKLTEVARKQGIAVSQAQGEKMNKRYARKPKTPAKIKS